MLSFFPHPVQPKAPQLQDILGYTLSDLLDIAHQNCPNRPLYFQSQGKGWVGYSNHDLKRFVNHTVAGLRQLGLEAGDRIALLLKSDFSFLAIDLACAQAGMITVPLDLSQTIENILYSLNHSEAHIPLCCESKYSQPTHALP
ncbi:MAG: acyl--CoA ligase [Acaryochloridaceae cyanobacterium RL_2_7]|nr:acyl--CoA ligase [Acaryochloridaceae cyanobacterium RL_2_7]